MVRTGKRMAVCLTLLILNLIFIWGNSCLPGEVSGNISAWVKDLIARLFGGELAEDDPSGHGLLRKLAHMTEFCCLGIWFAWLMHMLRQKKWQAAVLALGGGLLAACIDECIQIFVPGRGPGIKDVAIDMLGVTVGVALLTLVLIIRHGKRNTLEEIKQ